MLFRSNRHQFILVAIDYFTKWVEASSYAHVTQKVVKCFIEKSIMTEVLGQKLAFMDINNVEEGEGQDWNSNDEPKTAKEDELLPQLTVHSLEEAPTNAFVRKLSGDEVFCNWEIEEALVVFKK